MRMASRSVGGFSRSGAALAGFVQATSALPLHFFEVDAAGHVGHVPSQFDEMDDPPGHHEVDGQAVFQARGRAELAAAKLCSHL
jgi:hypothetical protein